DSLRYLGEAATAGVQPLWHLGSGLWWNNGIGKVVCLGRYFVATDPRCAHHDWSQWILKQKNDDQYAGEFAAVLARYLNHTAFSPNFVVPVPPKPGQRNRFAQLIRLAMPSLLKKMTLVPEGLVCTEAIEGYKQMDHAKRAEAVRGKYVSRQAWKG